ncbi:MAG: helix-turn-helix transcriptional regulator [Verrucomicrobia bacterium]|nr:helix-turn-helix transcriptional regulator [Verrucomicrobiota bacterium]
MPKSEKETEFYLTVGNRIRLARKENKIDQELLAKKIGLSRPSVINIEKGRQKPSLFQLWCISRYLDIPITDFIPPADLEIRIENWKEKIENIAGSNDEMQKVLIDFISTNSRIKLNP